MAAIDSEFIFQDTSLTLAALAYQKTFDLTLLTVLNMPWQADGIQRYGEHVRVPVDSLLREKLQSASTAFEVIYGTDEQRITDEFQAIARLTPAHITTNSIARHANITTANPPNRLKQ